jgi:hypothetical protein
MDLSALPTNNLYQFLALGGLLLLIVSLLGPWKQWERLEERHMDAQRALDTTKVEIEALKLAVARHKARAEECGGVFNEDGTFKVPPRLTPEQAEAVRGVSEALLQKAAEVRRAQASNTALAAYVGRTRARLRWLLLVAIGAGVVAVVLSGLGFYLWYTRVQVYQDELLRRQVVSSPPAPASPSPPATP